MAGASGQMLAGRSQQKEVGSRKWKAGKGRSTKISTQPRLSSVFCLLSCLLVLILATSCNPDRPNFEPSYSGAPPGEDLDQYLDTKVVFEGLDQVKGKRQQLDSLLTLADKLKNYNDDLALVYADTAYSMALERNWDLSRGIASYYIALLKGRREKYGEGIEEALVDANLSKKIFEKLNIDSWKIRTYNLIGLFYERKKENESALLYLEKAKEILENSGLEERDSINQRGELLHDIANVYKDVDTSLASQYFDESKDLYLVSANHAGLARLQFDWAQVFYQNRSYSKAENLIMEGLRYAQDHQDINAIILAYQKLGVLRLLQFRDLGTEYFFQEALINFTNCLNYQKEDLYFVQNKIAELYQLRAFANSNSEQQIYQDVDSSIIHYKRALEEARFEGVLSEMRRMGSNVSTLCNWRFRVLGEGCNGLLGKPSQDFLNGNYVAITDTIGQILQLANKRNRTNERREIEAKSRQRTRIQWIISGGGLLLAGLIFIVVLQGQQQKRLKAKMEALRAQINPHFISNSLNAIEGLVNLDKKEAATKYLIHFSRLTRKVLNSSRNGKVSLAEEIQTLEHFLELEQLRFRDKLRYLIDIDEEININLVEMPAMILQPYIENAIWHGIRPKEGSGLVKVQIEKVGKHLVCMIKDDGVGRAKAAEIKASSVLQQNSVGMKINQERLNVVGRAKGAKVEIIDLQEKDGQASGTKVVIRLPYKELTKT